ncbi:hypothetical protein L596_012417 [Steinernema carpocapsae]|uniref:Uncharacterized protein n=1 Tax=Steinernema carpocapsae TaxID=34508 RepID=A0A4U5NX46_STECR|nr:hypothetical protein L596_012417 [Steinernema carpocapsae]
MIINVCASSVSSHDSTSYYYMTPYFYPSLMASEVPPRQQTCLTLLAPLAETEADLKKPRALDPLRQLAIWIRKCIRLEKKKSKKRSE